MGSLLRLAHAHLGRTLALTATSAAAGFPASNLETGNRHLFWTATSTADQTLTYDAGVGLTATCDTVVLPRADLLVARDCDVVVQWSTDMAAWTDAFTAETPIQANDLAGPGATDYYKEFTTQTKRGWRVKLYGTPSSAVSLAGGLFLGARYEWPKNPLYGRALGGDRAGQGAELEVGVGHLPEASAVALVAQLAALNPGWPAEVPIRTVAGALRGGLPHYLYDPLGAVFRTAGTAVLWPAMLLTPEAVATITPAIGVERGPASLRWGKVT